MSKDDAQTPLDILADDEERPEAVVIDDVEIDAQQFVDALDALSGAAEDLSTLADDVAALQRTGLREQDVVDLLYGRNASLRKGTIQTVVETIAEVRSVASSPNKREELLLRLVSDLSGETLSDSREVIDELATLQRRYGDDGGEA